MNKKEVTLNIIENYDLNQIIKKFKTKEYDENGNKKCYTLRNFQKEFLFKTMLQRQYNQFIIFACRRAGKDLMALWAISIDAFSLLHKLRNLDNKVLAQMIWSLLKNKKSDEAYELYEQHKSGDQRVYFYSAGTIDQSWKILTGQTIDNYTVIDVGIPEEFRDLKKGNRGLSVNKIGGNIIHLKNGSIVRIIQIDHISSSSKSAIGQGESLCGVVISEGAFLPNLAGFIGKVMPALQSTNGWLIVESSVNGKKNYMYKLFKSGLDNNEQNVKSILIKGDDVEFSDEQRARYIADLTSNLPEKRAEVLRTYYCNFDIMDSSAVYEGYHFIEFPFMLDWKSPIFYSIDLGSKACTVITAAQTTTVDKLFNLLGNEWFKQMGWTSDDFGKQIIIILGHRKISGTIDMKFICEEIFTFNQEISDINRLPEWELDDDGQTYKNFNNIEYNKNIKDYRIKTIFLPWDASIASYRTTIAFDTYLKNYVYENNINCTIQNLKKTKSVWTGIGLVQRMLKSKRIIFSTQHFSTKDSLLTDLRDYKFKQTDEIEKGHIIKKDANDACDSLRYMVVGLKRYEFLDADHDLNHA